MPYNQKIYSRIREEYETKYLRAREAAELRRAEVHAVIPELAELDRAMRLTGLSIMEAAVSGTDVDARVAEVRRRNGELAETRRALLEEHGYSADYTEVRYECPLCADSGYVDCRMCVCMKRKLVEASFELSGMSHLLATQNFENFDLSYYMEDASAHRRMTQIHAKMQQYADTFVPGQAGNLVLFGGTGLGKTHLSTAVARTVIEQGHDVLYVSAVSLLSDFEAQRFGNHTSGGETGSDTERYFSCDLLIVDDLGTEVTNQFTTSVLYNLINTRLNRKRATIISTNLNQEEFRKRYWDRITSRVLGEYTVLPFLGKDIRAQKLGRKA